MIIESLNTWGGRLRLPLQEHVSNQAPKVKGFLFQEMNPSLYRKLIRILPDHHGHFAIAHRREGLAMFVSRDTETSPVADLVVHDGQFVDQRRILQYVQFEREGRLYTIINYHGMLTAAKADTDESIGQAHRVRAFLESVTGSKILCGDFNVMPDTETMRIIKGNDMVDLVTENNVKSTRNRHFKGEEQLADYILVSRGIVDKVRFEVLPDEVSDHLALVVDVDVG